MREKKKAKKATRAKSWKNDSQTLKLDLSSAPGRKRFFKMLLQRLAWIAIVIVAGLLVVLAIQLYQSWTVQPVVVKTNELPEIQITGNSSVPESHIRQIVVESIEPSLASINPFELKQILESNGQIRSVEIEKDFPDRLNIRVTERLPILMLATMDDENELTFWAIDEEGVVYKPFDLKRLKTLNLPFVEGLQLDKIEDGVTVVEGVHQVYYLLQLLKKDAYEVYDDIRSVSLLHYNRGEAELGAVIIFRGRQIKKLIFGVENFEFQIIKLIGVLSVSGKIRLSEKNVVDLSYSGDAIVR